MLQVFFVILALMLGAFPARATAANVMTENYDGRDIIVAVPTYLPAEGTRGLVVVLHGGQGNAEYIESLYSNYPLNMDAEGEKNGFLVAYLNGTQSARRLGYDKFDWNAGGGCCGIPVKKNVNDVDYITRAVAHLIATYGVDPHRVFGMGFSNGAMMTERLICETNLYAAAMAIAGPLNLDVASCPAARGKRILALHGVDDRDVPVAGGRGTRYRSNAWFQPESHAQQVFANSGAFYDLRLLQGTDHDLHRINAALQQTEMVSISEQATRFFGLSFHQEQ